MRINSIRKEKHSADTTKITVDLTIKNQHRDLWLITEDNNAEYFCLERCDGIIAMLLPELLLIGENIESDIPISEKLFYNLSKLIPALVDNSQGRFSNIEIHCPLSNTSFRSEHQKNATGMSFGIDSLYSYFSHRESPNHQAISPHYEANLITFFNNGSLNGEYKNNQDQMRVIFARGRERVIRFAAQQNVDYLTVDTNIDEFYSLNYTKTHTFRTIGIVLCFQKLIANYWFASSYRGGYRFAINPYQDSAYYDLLSLPSLSTESIDIYSDGYEKTRFEKTHFLTKVPETKEWLSVCWRDIENCSECPKCVRTMSTLEVLGKLDDYQCIFDLEKFRINHDWHWAKIMSLSKIDYFYKEVYQEALKRKHKFSLKPRILACLMRVGRAVLNPKLLSSVQGHIKHGK